MGLAVVRRLRFEWIKVEEGAVKEVKVYGLRFRGLGFGCAQSIRDPVLATGMKWY